MHGLFEARRLSLMAAKLITAMHAYAVVFILERKELARERLNEKKKTEIKRVCYEIIIIIIIIINKFNYDIFIKKKLKKKKKNVWRRYLPIQKYRFVLYLVSILA
jgi:hypothetical protein